MNISETVDKIVELRQQSGDSSEHVAAYLETTLRATGAHIEAQPITFSSQSQAYVTAIAFLLSMVFLISLLKNWRRAAIFSALAVPLILFLEFSLNIHVVSWSIQSASTNIIAHFPVQDAARKVVVGTHIDGARCQAVAPGPSQRFTETLRAFLFPTTVVITILGFWRIANFFGKFDSEDARTIMLVMGAVCMIFYGLLFGVEVLEAAGPASRDPGRNAGSVAALAALTSDLAEKYPRLQHTWVTVAFFGGSAEDPGSRELAKDMASEEKGGLPIYYIGLEDLGGGGSHGYVAPDNVALDALYADRELLRAVGATATAITGRPLDTAVGSIVSSRGFVEQDFPTATITTLPGESNNPGGIQKSRNIDRGQLLLSLQIIEGALQRLDGRTYPAPSE